MRAVQATRFGGPEVLAVRELPDPVPATGEVLIEVAAADVMFLDTRLRSGWGTDFFPVRPPYVPGGGVGGTVRAVGPGVDTAWLGARVVGPTAASGIGGGVPTGGYAERALVTEQTLLAVPAGLDIDRAVALVHDGRTALAAFDRATVQPGDLVLVTAAAGGLGTLLTQLAHRAGAKVVAAARGAAKLELAHRLGAHLSIDYSEPDWAEHARAATGGSGFHVVFDGVGGALGEAALAVTADGGRFLGYGSASGEFAGAHAAAARARGVEVVGLFDLQAGKPDWRALGAEALRMAAEGHLEVVVGQTFRLNQAAGAHAAIETRTAVGRTVLIP
ncbi:zinc-binding dehydrogenase [Nocardia farcinica]|uniref:zinc-binding dehydrogenase n=1 Tax=Nocardia farcinica TaxID=37329 RepID=UPI00245716BE|nr:zinc-binding dehydrogenase [Nocardia farcinica]